MRPNLFALTADLEESHWWFSARRRIMRALIERILPPSRESLIIDVGCGTGANIASLANDYACIGIDPSEVAIGLARARFPSVEFRVGSAPADLGESAQEADLFLLLDVLEHVEDDFAQFSAVASAARAGALILITVPADPSLWSEHDVSHGHYRRYEPDRLEMIWQDLPLRVRLMSYFNARLYPVIRAVREAGRILGRASGARETDLFQPPAPINGLLETIFAGERRRLVELLEGSRESGYRRGVSLIAVLEREHGRFEPRPRPPETPPDALLRSRSPV
ncbi:MAG TPA: class I SAM-dependent methyltransferase [Gemmatimonadota bacterium]|nr:class I SAM-dependent methyltransferase [Gemmatimonadota bacterium]